MALSPKFIPVETDAGWMVSIPASMSSTGQRIRKFFPTKTKAAAYAATVRSAHSAGMRGSMISATLANQAAAAERILEGSGITLVDAAQMAVAKLGIADSLETFKARYIRAVGANEGVWSDKYQTQMDAVLRWLPESFLRRSCGTIDKQVIESALKEFQPTLKQSTVEMKAARVLAIVGFQPRHKKTSEISILTVSQCAKLLRVCESKNERWAVALLLFAGIRPDAETGEISRLDWSAVSEDSIYISGAVSKTNSDRHIPILPRLKRLLRGHPKSGPVKTPNWRRVWQRIRKSAGIAEMQDVCRHTFASHYLAMTSEHDAKLALGHTAASSTLFRFYLRAVKKEDGEKYFR